LKRKSDVEITPRSSDGFRVTFAATVVGAGQGGYSQVA